MKITKSTRHQKIIGNFGENLICNWLSRSGFEVSIIDHTGIDIIAYDPNSKKRLGITVKSRTREIGKENHSVNIFYNNKNDRKKVLDACLSYACEPWIAVYVESLDFADIFITSLKNYDQKYRGNNDKVIDDWKMGKTYREQYKNDPNIQCIEIKFDVSGWKW